MKKILLVSIFLAMASGAKAQLWSGILSPTYGAGACTFAQITAAGQCAIDWTQVGIPGGIPTNWTQSGSTINTSAGVCDSTHDCTSTIQTALNSCAGTSLPGKYVLLGAGTFLVTGNLSIMKYCYLAGAGPQSTILLAENTSGVPVAMGTPYDDPYNNGSCTITGGNTAGSTSLTLSAKDINNSTCSISTNGFLVISELNNPVMVSSASPQNPGGCGYCDVIFSGNRLREQIVQATNVTGSGPFTVTVSPALYTDYGTATGTSPAYATPFGFYSGGSPDCIYCGLQNIQIYATGTNVASGKSEVALAECAFCFIQNVEINYSDGDWVDAGYCYRCEFRSNYFTNGFGHGAGSTDNDFSLYEESSASLLINNIFERGHSDVFVDLGAAGNVIAYNYSTGGFDAAAPGYAIYDFDQHGAFPQFNLWEGNVGVNWNPDAWHGNNGYNTVFRNWWTGTNLIATYPTQAISSISCSSGTCTITWASPPSTIYTGTYIDIFGTSSSQCGSGSSPALGGSLNVQLTGTSGQVASTFASGSCSSATGGYAAPTDLSKYPTPITHQAIQWASAYAAYQAAWPVAIPAFSVNNNLIGNAFGSSLMSTTAGGSGYYYNGGSGSCTSCMRYPTSRPYPLAGSLGGQAVLTNYGYDVAGDGASPGWSTFPGGPSSTNGYWSNQGFITTCYSGNYDMASGSTINSVNCSPSTTLPASFFLSAQPAFWATKYGTPPWPAIGPDVSGGPDSTVGNHANYIPAELCYNGLSRDSTGAKQFDWNACSAPQALPGGFFTIADILNF